MSADNDLPAISGGSPVCPDGPPTWPFDWPYVREAAERALADGSWGRYHGPHCDELRERLAEFHAYSGPTAEPLRPEVILCCSGTTAVELALRAARVAPGDEVILAAYDFRANFQNILTIGATPVLVDLDAESWQLDVSQVEAAISDKTRAVIAAHLHGASVDMPRLMQIAEAHRLTVIEDACQATGAIFNGQRAGTQGHAGVLSFGGSKLLTAGRGGAILANRPEISQRIRLYAERGNSAYPLSELQAALLVPQLQRLEDRNRHRLQNVVRLVERLDSFPGLRPIFTLPGDSEPDYLPAFYKAGFQFDPAAVGMTRDEFAAAVRAEGVAFDPGFRSFPKTHSRRRYRAELDLPIADQADQKMLVLHHPVLLGGPQDMQAIVQAIHRAAAAR
ncbi:MAG: DegT/DnrJ/EryC1/StrS family aminotransferase [Planctomycetota bacterium]|jgi:dTDP-4-amino-4,6-dideoxygalactose transaminase